jgi:AcrR family transcriptional regulator
MMGQEMIERTNRRDVIIKEASRLFVEQGYAATSVRQIAEAVGCTEAALYYHFKEGKRELLQAVLEHMIPDLLGAVEECHSAKSLHDLVVSFAHGMACEAQEHMISRMRWIMTEFPNLAGDERALLYQKHLLFRKGLTEQIRRFVASDVEAERLAWLLVFVVFGYGQLMISLDMQSFAGFDLDGFIEFLAAQVTAGHAAERNQGRLASPSES